MFYRFFCSGNKDTFSVVDTEFHSYYAKSTSSYCLNIFLSYSIFIEIIMYVVASHPPIGMWPKNGIFIEFTLCTHDAQIVSNVASRTYEINVCLHLPCGKPWLIRFGLGKSRSEFTCFCYYLIPKLIRLNYSIHTNSASNSCVNADLMLLNDGITLFWHHDCLIIPQLESSTDMLWIA